MVDLRRHKGFVILLWLWAFVTGCQRDTLTAEGIRWKPYEEAIAEGKETGKPVLILFVSRGCPSCEQLEETLKDPEIARLLNEEFLPVRIEAERNPELTLHFRVFGFPTMWFYRRGDLLGPVVGYLAPGHLRKLLLYVLGAGSSP